MTRPTSQEEQFKAFIETLYAYDHVGGYAPLELDDADFKKLNDYITTHYTPKTEQQLSCSVARIQGNMCPNHGYDCPNGAVSNNTEQQAVGGEERRDWDAYFLMNTVYLLRTLKVMDSLTPIQHKLVEEHCKLRAATVRQDTDQLISRHYITKEAVATAIGDVPESTGKYSGAMFGMFNERIRMLHALNLDSGTEAK